MKKIRVMKMKTTWATTFFRSLFVGVLCLATFSACSDDDPAPTPSGSPDASKYALVDLHLHLDGSLTPEDVLEMAKLGGNVSDLPSTD